MSRLPVELRVTIALTVALVAVVSGCARGARPETTARTGPPPAPEVRTPVAPVAPAPNAVTPVRPGDYAATLAARRQTLIDNGQRLVPEEVGYYMDVQEARLRQLVGTGLRVTRREHSVILELPGQLTFDVGSARLSPRALVALSSVAKVLVVYRLSVISVHGHTDDSGDAALNRALSEQRALAVAKYLIGEGVDAGRIVVVGHGSDDPLVANTSEEGREANRRVELQVDALKP